MVLINYLVTWTHQNNPADLQGVTKAVLLLGGAAFFFYGHTPVDDAHHRMKKKSGIFIKKEPLSAQRPRSGQWIKAIVMRLSWRGIKPVTMDCCGTISEAEKAYVVALCFYYMQTPAFRAFLIGQNIFQGDMLLEQSRQIVCLIKRSFCCQKVGNVLYF